VTGEGIAVTRRTETGWSVPTVITAIEEFATYPDWHPTEDLIVFSTYDLSSFQDTDQPSNLFTMRPDGTETTQVTDFGPGGVRATQPTWTPDGRILFTHVTGDADEVRHAATINVDGTGLEVLMHELATHSRLRPT
jgi:Tol biopolymer transport system component